LLLEQILADVTRSLQHKQDQVVRSQEQLALLADLNALPSPQSIKSQSDEVASVEGTKINPLFEPNPTLPLWRRVDKRFWWNEWLLKPFVDAGVIIISKSYCIDISDHR
jgi:hypothetical protein